MLRVWEKAEEPYFNEQFCVAAGFAHKDNPQSIDLNCVRLCFQVFLEGSERGAFTFALKPVVSDPIYDKKAKNDLTICKLTECAAPVSGGKEILLFCEKVSKDDIEVRFFQEKDGQLVWEGWGAFTNVVKLFNFGNDGKLEVTPK